jgi:hypothetical protein
MKILSNYQWKWHSFYHCAKYSHKLRHSFLFNWVKFFQPNMLNWHVFKMYVKILTCIFNRTCNLQIFWKINITFILNIYQFNKLIFSLKKKIHFSAQFKEKFCLLHNIQSGTHKIHAIHGLFKTQQSWQPT